ncbi:MAG: cyclic nucleotide-binding domain-containing protein [Chloroflexi bacterium]|nr:cyclic nucleotide-binding domain-containing protein [Chloroflexota bacterium]
MEVASCVEVLRNSVLFRDLTAEQLTRVALLCQEESFGAGHILFSEGDTPDKVYLVQHGKVALDMGLSFGPHVKRRVTIEIVTRGQALGWSAVTGSEALTATARCLEKTSALAIKGSELRGLFDADPHMGYQVQKQTVDLVRSRLANARDTLAHILTVVSHDLRAPVHAVQSYHQVMLGGYAGSLTQQQQEMIGRSTERLKGLLGLIDEMLDISRIESTEMDKAATSLGDMIGASLENVRPQAKQKELKLETDFPGADVMVMASSSRMQQVMTNLLSNAVKFTPEGGNIRVRTRAVAEIAIVEVMDSGQGIPEDELPKVFDEFYRGRNATPGGIGLGLSIAKKIIEAHNGRIWVESPYPESVRGTKFTFTLPRVGYPASGKESPGDNE